MFSFSSKEKRKEEEYLYSIVAEELDRNEINKPLWAKALANTLNDQQKSKALYIKYRVQKLKDDILEKKEQEEDLAQKEHQSKIKIEKDLVNLNVLNTVVSKTLSSFHWLIGLIIVLSFGILFFAYISYDLGEPYKKYIVISILIFIISFYLLYLTFKVKRIVDYSKIKKILNILFVILIPFSLFGSFSVFISPILGLGMFVMFMGLIIRAFKFYSAFNYAKKHNLI